MCGVAVVVVVSGRRSLDLDRVTVSGPRCETRWSGLVEGSRDPVPRPVDRCSGGGGGLTGWGGDGPAGVVGEAEVEESFQVDRRAAV